MKVWGIGTNWWTDDTKTRFNDRTNHFLNDGVAAIGWSKDKAPGLYAMADEVEIGDIIYLKSYIIKGSQIRIKAIGKVTNNNYKTPKYEGCRVFKVEWLKMERLEKIPLTDAEKTNNVFRNTLYREYNPRIIQIIMKKLKSNINNKAVL